MPAIMAPIITPIDLAVLSIHVLGFSFTRRITTESKDQKTKIKTRDIRPRGKVSVLTLASESYSVVGFAGF